MACKFWFTVKYSQKDEGAIFQSANGDEYRVKYNSTNLKDLMLSIEWKFISSVLIMAEVYTDDLRNSLSSKGQVFRCNGAILTLFDVFNSRSSFEDDYRCSISVIPYVEFQNIPASTNSESNPNLPAETWPAEKRLDSLSLDMQNLLNRSDLSDVVVTVGSVQMNVHTLVLSARSSVFDKMFQRNFEENRENRITIYDLSADVLKEMIIFMYKGVVVIKDIQMAQNLYVAAGTYDIKDLRFVCSALIKNNITLDSVLDTLVWACLITDYDLKKCTMEFIATNYSDLKKHKSWNRFVQENNTLCIEILNFVIEKTHTH